MYGEQLYNVRKSKRMSQETLAEKVGCTQRTISYYELGKSSPDIPRADAIAKALGTENLYFVTEDNKADV